MDHIFVKITSEGRETNEKFWYTAFIDNFSFLEICVLQVKTFVWTTFSSFSIMVDLTFISFWVNGVMLKIRIWTFVNWQLKQCLKYSSKFTFTCILNVTRNKWLDIKKTWSFRYLSYFSGFHDTTLTNNLKDHYQDSTSVLM